MVKRQLYKKLVRVLALLLALRLQMAIADASAVGDMSRQRLIL